jgi:ATP-dependent Clp protease adaptor protein ClpS
MIQVFNMKAGHQEKELQETLEVIEVIDVNNLVVFNDDFNTFDHVIQTLIKVCKHTPEQAEQCTWLIHYKGKCAVRSGPVEELKPMRQAICDAGIDARIL